MGASLRHRRVEHADYQRVVELLVAYRAATGVDGYPTAWRLRLLLTSRVWEPARDTRLWEDTGGEMVGFGMLWRRGVEDTYLVLDRFVHPMHATDDLARQMLTWADQRAHSLGAERATPLTLFVNQLAPGICPDSALAALGFAKTAAGTEAHNVYFARSLRAALPATALPPEYTARQLRDDEIEAYQALYGFAEVSVAHRRELLASDEYSHLVIADRAGALVAYCECSISRLEWQLSGQRIGWIDYIGTRPDQRRQGLGRAILLAGLARLRSWGARTAQLLTISSNIPAIALYRSAGFTRIDVPEAPGYEKQILPV